MVLGLVEPESSGIGGGAFLLYWSKREKKLRSYDGRETAPAAARADRFLDSRRQRPLASWMRSSAGARSAFRACCACSSSRTAATAGCRGAELFEPAISAAEQGFRSRRRLHALLEGEKYLRKDRDARASSIYGKPAASAIVNREYAATLRLVAAQGADAFYNGEIAKDIVARGAHARQAGRPHGSTTWRGYRADRARAGLRAATACGACARWGRRARAASRVLQILGILERTAFRARAAAVGRSGALLHRGRAAGLRRSRALSRRSGFRERSRRASA